MVKLTALQRDAIAELLNIGMGRAVFALSQMVGEEVQLSVPWVEVLSRAAIADLLKWQAADQVAAVEQRFAGPFRGEALLLFPKEESLELVRSLLQDTVPLESLTDLEQEALMEVGNIILNACLGSIADLLHGEVSSSLPVYLQGTCEAIVQGMESLGEEDDVVLFVCVDFVLRTKNISGYVALLMSITSLAAFMDRVDQYLISPVC